MRIDLAKNNFSPRVEDALSWLEMRDYGLSNGYDTVGAPVPFDLAEQCAAATNTAESKAWLERAAKLGQIVDLLGGEPERPVADLLDELMVIWNVKGTKAREELDKLVPRGREHAEMARAGVLVWQETRGRSLVVCQHEEPDFEPAEVA